MNEKYIFPLYNKDRKKDEPNKIIRAYDLRNIRDTAQEIEDLAVNIRIREVSKEHEIQTYFLIHTMSQNLVQKINFLLTKELDE